MKLYTFTDYKVVDKGDYLEYLSNKTGDVLGYSPRFEEDIESLDNGADPIEEGWKDGLGNILTLDGWGDAGLDIRISEITECWDIVSEKQLNKIRNIPAVSVRKLGFSEKYKGIRYELISDGTNEILGRVVVQDHE